MYVQQNMRKRFYLFVAYQNEQYVEIGEDSKNSHYDTQRSKYQSKHVEEKSNSLRIQTSSNSKSESEKNIKKYKISIGILRLLQCTHLYYWQGHINIGQSEFLARFTHYTLSSLKLTPFQGESFQSRNSQLYFMLQGERFVNTCSFLK